MNGNGKPYRFNIVKHRGDPKTAVLESGDTVTKEEYIYFPDENGQMRSVQCADYHGEHFVYKNPLAFMDGPQWRGQWFAMCTCGSMAVVLDPKTAESHTAGMKTSLLVCYNYMLTLEQFGVGRHATGHRQWW